MKTGIIRNYSDTRGYGFIETDEPGPDIFVHSSALCDELPDSMNGLRVRFDIIDSPKKPGAKCADNVRAA